MVTMVNRKYFEMLTGVVLRDVPQNTEFKYVNFFIYSNK